MEDVSIKWVLTTVRRADSRVVNKTDKTKVRVMEIYTVTFALFKTTSNWLKVINLIMDFIKNRINNPGNLSSKNHYK